MRTCKFVVALIFLLKLSRSIRFGMSALYQLRGRVGRSSRQAYCYFLTPPLKQITEKSKQRLGYLMEFTSLGSGYQLALQDKKIRGSGSVFGKEQSGENTLGISCCKLVVKQLRRVQVMICKLIICFKLIIR